jgi:glycosyltransferase involved in cell wall biosynthesis
LTACATTECCTKRPRLFDVDDAIWLRLKLTSGFAKKIVRNMDGLICGNRWIADYFADCNVPIWVVPTGIDTIRWHPATTKQRKPFYFGWIGTSGNYKYLYDIEQAFYTFFNKFPQAKLLIVAERRPNFLYLSKKNIHFVRWSKTNEVQAVQQMNVGLMPLRNTDWERGKCAFKMLVYMAVGIPVIVSPIGMNNEILSKGTIGFGPVSHSDWIDSLMILYQNSTMRKQMGETGRKIVEDYYSTTITTEQLSNIFHKVS